MKKFLATILTLCALVCCAVGLSACGDDGNYDKGPNATARPNVTTVADETEWEKLLSLRDSYPCTIERQEVFSSQAYSFYVGYNGKVMKLYDNLYPTAYFEIDGDDCYFYESINGKYEKRLATGELTVESAYDSYLGYAARIFSTRPFTFSDFTYNESTLRYESGDSYVKFVDGRFSEACYSDSYKTITFKVTYGKVDITLPKV